MVDLKKMAESWLVTNHTYTVGRLDIDLVPFARAVSEAVLDEARSRMKPDTLLMMHGVATAALWPEDLRALKRELCGPEGEVKP
jgi:hypothetical protein